MIEALLRPVARARYRRVLDESTIVSRDAPAVLTGDNDALRVLLLGSGVASGRGVATYGLALVGALQRALSRSLDHPVDVELVRQHGAGIAEAAAIATPRLEEDWDACVLAFGLSDALQLTSSRRWVGGMELLLSTIEDRRRSPFPVPVVAAGIPPLVSFAAHRGVLLPIFSRHAERLNQTTSQLTGRYPGAEYVSLPPMPASSERPYGYPEMYATWAEAIAARLAPTLRSRQVRRVGPRSRAELEPLTRTVLADPSLRGRLTELAAAAAAALHGEYAVVRLLDGDRLCAVADSIDAEPRSVARDSTLCSRALADGFARVDRIESGGAAELRLAAAHGVRSYTGAALFGPSGAAIGTLAVFDGVAPEDEHRPRLMQLAQQAEALLAPLVDAVDPSTVEQRDLVHELRNPPQPARLELHDREDEVAMPSLWRRAVLTMERPTRLTQEGELLVQEAQRRVVPAHRVFAIGGGEPVRMLLCGGGYAIGHGVEDRADALDGVLARLLHRRTGRSVEVVNRAAPTALLSELRTSLGDEGAAGFDLVVWTPVFEEAAGRLRVAHWVVQLSAVIRRVQATSDAGIVLMGFPMLLGNQPLAVLARVRARQINRALAVVASRFPRTVVAQPAPVRLRDVERIEGAEVYRAAGVHMIDRVVEVLSLDGVRAAP